MILSGTFSRVCFFFDNPPLYPPDFVTEIYTYLIKGSAIRGKGGSVAFLIDLADGFFGTAIQLELHDVDVAVGLHHHVYATVGCTVFCLSIETQQLEDDEEHVLVVPFQVARQLVGRLRTSLTKLLISKEGLPEVRDA